MRDDRDLPRLTVAFSIGNTSLSKIRKKGRKGVAQPGSAVEAAKRVGATYALRLQKHTVPQQQSTLRASSIIHRCDSDTGIRCKMIRKKYCVISLLTKAFKAET